MERRWISPKECAEYLGLHLKSIYRLLDRGEIRAGKIGRSIRIDLNALNEKLMQGNDVEWKKM